MRKKIGRVLRRLWRVVVPDIASMKVAQFSVPPSDVIKANVAGPAADIFFSNEGPLINKWLHYLPIYERLSAPYIGSPVKMLEIGVSQGGSLSLWRRFLGANAAIFGIDVDQRCAAFDGVAGQVRIGSQDDRSFLSEVVMEMGGIDIVLDDGSHIGRHQQTSFEALFPLLSEGGLYIIEDLHTAYWPGHEGGLRAKGSGIEFLKAKVDEMHSHYYEPKTADPVSGIESIQFFDSIAVVTKRHQLPRRHMKVGYDIPAQVPFG